MKLYMHPVSMTSRPVRLFIAEHAIACEEVVVDLMTGEHYKEPFTSVNPAYRDTMAAPDGDDWRGAFAASLVQDPMFARNLANRLWKQMFGLPLADPVDGLDPARLDLAASPPEPWGFQATHPELLEKLAAELTKQDFRLRPFLRTLVQSSAYQLSSLVTGEWSEPGVPLFARHYPRRLLGEEVHDAITKATGALPSYTAQGLDSVQWAMQLPDTSEPRNNAPVNTAALCLVIGGKPHCRSVAINMGTRSTSEYPVSLLSTAITKLARDSTA